MKENKNDIEELKEVIIESHLLIRHLLSKHFSKDMAKCGTCQKYIFG